MVKKVVQKDKKKAVAGVKASSNTASNKTVLNFPSLELLILLLYLIIEFIPQFDTGDAMGIQWLYISVLNIFVTLYLLIRKKNVPNVFF